MKILIILLATISALWSQDKIIVASKKFTENIILADIAGQILRTQGYQVEHRAELGGTRVLWNALLNGNVDLYPEYSGTIRQEILAGKKYQNFDQVKSHLDSIGIEVIGPLGFNNTYALGMLKSHAKAFKIKTISDLSRHPTLVFGFTNDTFLDFC